MIKAILLNAAIAIGCVAIAVGIVLIPCMREVDIFVRGLLLAMFAMTTVNRTKEIKRLLVSRK